MKEKPSETERHHSVHSDAQSHEEHIQGGTQEITKNASQDNIVSFCSAAYK